VNIGKRQRKVVVTPSPEPEPVPEPEPAPAGQAQAGVPAAGRPGDDDLAGAQEAQRARLARAAADPR
jgi:hypothetical protein